ncbi:MAG: FAD-dependent oxidoreductase [Candidatus Abyssobacteria bacterium SURF_5]|uniref:FAD-dependent oxidoreductase n=1 Tax=Abyssobacteria bacterium (strain SURF_5) TaxID=2093360 RepID=A0A3A4NYZ7_ABYX5|nr:MAG: FAD-dependent oxidoreductase [Candidatus Abyssubacteria bacterium SURF_5]
MEEDTRSDMASDDGKISRRSFLAGAAAGAAGAWGISYGLKAMAVDPSRPPDLYEFFLDNFWFKEAELERERLNPPLKGSHQADIVIIGGGFTGLSSALHLSRLLPQKKIVLLEGACCGYGASGRNGGFCDAGIPGLMDYVHEAGPELGRKAFDATLYGLKQIRELSTEHGVKCDFEENGMLEAAMDEEQAENLEKEYELYKTMGLDATIVQGQELKMEVNSPRYLALLKFPYGGIVNPAKLARGMKPLIEKAGVEVHECTVVMRVTPGKQHRVETEMGEITAPILVLGLNGYSSKIGFFKNRVMPLCSYVIATEPLSQAQWDSIGWKNRQGMADMRVLFDYQRPSADGRIVIGGSDYPYFANDQLSSGNNKPVIELLTQSLLTTFPQLEGIRIDHAWGGTMGFTLDFTPSVGVLGDDNNLFYGVAYNGEGVAFGQTAGRIIAELVAGERSGLTDLFVLNHKIPYAGPQSARFLSARLHKWYLTRTSSKTVR